MAKVTISAGKSIQQKKIKSKKTLILLTSINIMISSIILLKVFGVF